MKYGENQRQLLRALCDRSFFHFVKLVGGWVHQGGIITEAIHRPLCEFAQDRNIKRKAIFMPRDWLKSTVFTKWKKIWDYLQDNEKRILIVSENENIAARFLDFMERQILQNDFLRWIYPELQIIDRAWTRGHRWSNTQCELPRQGIYSEATFTSIGIGGAAQSGHYDLSIDDPAGRKSLESLTVLEGVLRWIDNCHELLINPNPEHPDGSEISICATFWGPSDFGTYIIDKYPEFQFRIVPAMKDNTLKNVGNIQWVQNPNVVGFESNWPESDKFTTKYYLDMMANPEKELVFWTQHQNNPYKASQLTKFDPSWFHYAHLDELTDDDQKKKTFVVLEDKKDKMGRPEMAPLEDFDLYGFLDPGGFATVKATKSSSRNAIVIAGKTRESRIVVIFYAWAGRLQSVDKYIDEVIKAHKLFKPKWLIEIAGQQEYIRKSIQEASIVKECPLHIYPVEADTRENAKNMRITETIGPLQQGRIYFCRSIPSMSDLKQEYKSFPGLTQDLIDAFGYLWKLRLGHGTGPKSDIDDRNKQRYREYLEAHGRA
jgi:hypothetical protein